ncbi:putative ABC transport system permease protein [Kushneria sinocarnis]|uniref:Putative ABC transport system permease protein n=1 Tax=Kushneria sinocarnis TaxID=595502 RepID=A0A420WX69_9GAMM|nr:ABC transporter permease [Kushneria sinocarnis]RKR04287.1 putative ABC transport system permease protein [Kushneria sinocarnis]
MTGQLTLWRTLFSHYRRHPGQLAMALLGIVLAGALYSGVQTINDQARDSFARAEAMLGGERVDRLQAPAGDQLQQADFVQLRRAGVPVSPLVRGQVTLENGQQLTLLGLDLPTLPPAMQPDAGAAGGSGTLGGSFMQPPWQLRLAPDSARALGLQSGDRPRLGDGRRLPPITLQPRLAPDSGITDIAAAAALLERGRHIDALLLPHSATLPPSLADRYRRVSADQALAPGELSASFRLNLTAMGLLALVVGLFIVHSAMGLALSQRLDSLAVLRALGVSRRALVTGVLIELLVLGVAGAILGLIAGVGLAGLLMPGVSQTLASLYDERVAGAVMLTPRAIASGLGMTLLGTLTAGLTTLRHAAGINVLASAHAAFEARGGMRRRLRLAALGAIVLLGAALLWWRLASASGGLLEGHRLAASFVVVAGLLIGSALGLPALLDGAITLFTRAGRRATLHWLLADTRAQLPRLSLALAALLLALSANLGVSGMVGGFRLTFLDWLDQRLSAELFVHAPADRVEAMQQWLAGQPGVGTVQRLRQLEGRVAGRPVDVRALPIDSHTRARWPLLNATADPWQRVARQDSVLINEQLARQLQRQPGDSLDFTTPEGRFNATIAGIYADYGNPRGELTLARAAAEGRWPTSADRTSLLLYDLHGDRQALAGQLQRHFALTGEDMIDQPALKQRARQVFERTFAITRALNALTLGVAALALLSALLALGRWRRARLAPLWAMGLTRRWLALASAGQILLLVLLTALLALPLGVLLNQALVALINVEAFGWRLPLHVFPLQLLQSVLVAGVVALLGGAITALQLWRTPPRRLLEEFRS